MGFRINTNILSLNAQRNLSKTTKAFAKSLERLSSGSRINRAGDDAAGLAIGSGIEAQMRAIARGIRNINDARGFLETAEGAMAEQTNIIQRMRELALQAANGTIGSKERGYLDSELQSLVDEFNRITEQTDFNGTKLLDGSFSKLSVQIGAESQQSIAISIEQVQLDPEITEEVDMPNGTYQEPVSDDFDADESFLGDFNNDGILDRASADGDSSVFIEIGNGDGTFGPTQVVAGGQDVSLWRVGDFDGDGYDDLATQVGDDNRSTQILSNNQDLTFTQSDSIFWGNSSPDFAFEDVNDDGVIDLIAIMRGTNQGRSYIGHGDATFDLDFTFSSNDDLSNIEFGDVNNDGNLDIIGHQGFGGVLFGLHLGDGTGAFGALSLSSVTGNDSFLGDLNNDGNLDILISDLVNDVVRPLYGNGDGTFEIGETAEIEAAAFVAALEDANGDDVLDIITQVGSDYFSMVQNLETIEQKRRLSLNIATTEAAQDFLLLVDKNLQTLNAQRSAIGA